MKKLATVIFALFILLLPVISQSKSVNETKTKHEEIDILMKHCYENGMFNGTILVSENGKVIYRNAFGYANLGTKEQLITESAFYLASVSKQFTSMAIMILKEKNKLKYSDKLSKYFPEFPAYADDVTIKQLMTHTSGIPNHYRLGAYKPNLKNSDVLEILIKQKSLDFNPGDRYSYSNGGYVLLAMIAEKASGVPFHIFMDENIFKPLGMNKTLVFDESKPKVKNRALGYNMFNELNDYEILTTGAGGIYSTINDLFLWDQSLYTEILVTRESINEAFTPTVLNDGKISNYGFGWAITGNNQNKSVSHGGSLAGFRTYIKRDITKKNAYIILTNNGNAVKLTEINNAIENILGNSSYALPKIPISAKLIDLLEVNNTETALNLTREILKNQQNEYQIDELVINGIGYKYLNEGNMETAIAIFKFNIELNPTSSNVFDSMGEAYMNKGDTTQAIINYKKSIQLHPNNSNAIKMLAIMGEDTTNLVPKITISAEIMDTYVGKYELSPGFIIAISRTEEQLFAQATGQPTIEIYPASETRFFIKEVDAQITFNKGLYAKND